MRSRIKIVRKRKMLQPMMVVLRDKKVISVSEMAIIQDVNGFASI